MSKNIEEILDNLVWKKDKDMWSAKHFFSNGKDRIWIQIHNMHYERPSSAPLWTWYMYVYHDQYDTEICNEGNDNEKEVKTDFFDTPEECWESAKKEIISLTTLFERIYVGWLYNQTEEI